LLQWNARKKIIALPLLTHIPVHFFLSPVTSTHLEFPVAGESFG
jgi:hypothetical protein